MLGGISIWQLLIILVIVMMLFGTKKLRNMGSDLGSAIKGFRKGMSEEEPEKLEADPMQGAFAADRSDYYYLEDVPWILYFDKSRALHGAYWHNGYGYPRSHGCVNLSPADAQWLYNWAEVGTYVHVFDPSGRTPTDAELYGEGGA